MMKGEYISKEQFCKECHVGKQTALWLIQNGLLPAINTTRKTDRYLISRVDIAHYLRNHELESKKYRYNKYRRPRRAAPLKNRVKEAVRVTPADLKRAEDTQTVIPDYEIEAMARVLLPALRAFYASPEGQAAFEEWKRNQEHT